MKQKGQTIIMLRAKKYCAVAVQSKASSFIRKLSFSLRICKKKPINSCDWRICKIIYRISL